MLLHILYTPGGVPAASRRRVVAAEWSEPMSTTPGAALQPQRTIDELKELRALTGDAEGAQRVAFTDTWVTARSWMREKLAQLPVEVEIDAAGNQWATLRGTSDKELLIGGHIDSVPNGGWLDGCLNVLAGLEVLRRIAAEGTPPVTVRLVDWADEEGARFGRSLFGSSAASGNFDPEDLAELKDKDGITLPDALKRVGIDLYTARRASEQLKNAAAYLELHIEQGPVLESMELPLGVVLGTFGVERYRIIWKGQAAHSGSTPMDKRRDALAGAAKMALEIRDIARRAGNGAVCTSGGVVCRPGIVTSVVETAEQLLDQRHLDPDTLAQMLQDAKDASARFAKEEKIDVTWERIWNIEPIPFHPDLIELCDQAILETCGVSHRLPSGPLHDAAEVCRAGVPTIMLFVQSLRGISHNKIEDTKEAHIALSVEALDRLASKTIDWIVAQG
jgi:N-carbamoyl-L-amino-acid hydrolase